MCTIQILLRAAIVIILVSTVDHARATEAVSKLAKDSFPAAIKTETGKLTYQLNDIAAKKAVVVVAHGIGCPVMRQNYVGFIALEREFSQDAEFIYVNGNPQDTAEAIATEAKSYGVENRVGLDPEQKWLRAFGLKTVGESAIAIRQADGSFNIVFRGGISDRVNFDRALAKPKKEFLKNALKEVIKGRKVTKATAPTFGCAITFN